MNLQDGSSFSLPSSVSGASSVGNEGYYQPRLPHPLFLSQLRQQLPEGACTLEPFSLGSVSCGLVSVLEATPIAKLRKKMTRLPLQANTLSPLTPTILRGRQGSRGHMRTRLGYIAICVQQGCCNDIATMISCNNLLIKG